VTQHLWLLVDCHNLAHRAFHTTGGLSHNGLSTGVSYGLLRDLEGFTEHFAATRVILAWDGTSIHGACKRTELCPDYKQTRRGRQFNEAERTARDDFYEELIRLRTEILPEVGYANILRAIGYEGDDILAKIADELPAGVEAVIISSDKDLWQCLSDRVVCFNPINKKVMTSGTFRQQWGLHPTEWASVKALAGCVTDDVEGIDGIGEVTAAKWFRGELKHTTAAYQKIRDNLDVYNRNIGLVRLPFPGLELPNLQDDTVTVAKLQRVRDSLGIKSRFVGREFDRGRV
jgi:DNA polymerase-1